MSEAAYEGPERREIPALSEEQVELIAERAAVKAVVLAVPKVKEEIEKDIYAGIGKVVVKRVLTIIGVAAMLFAGWLGLKYGIGGPK